MELKTIFLLVKVGAPVIASVEAPSPPPTRWVSYQRTITIVGAPSAGHGPLPKEEAARVVFRH
jgi:hypothetical protein